MRGFDDLHLFGACYLMLGASPLGDGPIVEIARKLREIQGDQARTWAAVADSPGIEERYGFG